MLLQAFCYQRPYVTIKATHIGVCMKKITTAQKMLIIPAMVIVGTGAVVWSVWTVLNRASTENTNNVAGTNAFIEEDADLGVAKVITKQDVADALGKRAKSVKDVDVSKVFNYNGNRGQTATYVFTRDDGIESSIYVDTMQFKSKAELKGARIYTSTGDAGKINNHPAYYLVAQTLGAIREYRLMIVDDLKIYKFVMEQPVSNISIGETTAVAALLRVARKANLNI